MGMISRDEFLERMNAEGKPDCPHCGKEMNVWEVPPVNFSDGLGWGVPYLYVCFNDECSLYKEGWENISQNFGQQASYRCMCVPGEKGFECMPVFSPMGATGQIIDDQVKMQEEMLKENTKKGFSILADCYVRKDGVSCLLLLTDSAEPPRVRLKAAEMIGDIGEIEAIDALRSMKFPNDPLQRQVDAAVTKIHERHFTRECPFCAEIIKKRASVCKHCQKDVAGV